MKRSKYQLINELNEAWIAMFNNIDDVVEEITEYYPDFQSKINREVIKNAITKTSKLSRFLEEGESKMSSL